MSHLTSSFQQQYRGRFVSTLRWSQLETLWQSVLAHPEGWHVYFIGHAVPQEPIDIAGLKLFIEEIDALLKRDHDYDYCGIVYADSFDMPSIIKVYDPNNLGASCGSSGKQIHPRWLLSRVQPEEIIDDAPIPMNRKRWWERLLG